LRNEIPKKVSCCGKIKEKIMEKFKVFLIKHVVYNRLLISCWHSLPVKMRLYAFRKFLFVVRNYGKLAVALIDIMENEPQLVVGLSKKDEILKFLKKHKDGLISLDFLEMWIDKSGPKPVFNFNGALLPFLKGDDLIIFMDAYLDTFLFSMFFDDNYSVSLVNRLEGFMQEGPYGYTDKKENFDVSLKAGDTAIDAGAWIGDFSAYAVARKADVYAFEPTSEVFKTLQEVAALNNMFNGGGGGGKYFQSRLGLEQVIAN
jgi:hypothetical protein